MALCQSCKKVDTYGGPYCQKCTKEKKNVAKIIEPKKEHTMRFRGMPGFEQYVEFQDQQDTGPNSQQPGTFQVDPDKDTHDNDLESALQEIIEIAKKALEMREKGLGDAGSQKKGNEEGDKMSFNRLATRPASDSPESQYGQGDTGGNS